MRSNPSFKKVIAIMLTWVLILANGSLATVAAADGGGTVIGNNGTVLNAVYGTDFGDTAALDTPNWGFSTANATVSTTTYNVGGNGTQKLQFTQTSQTGGRVAKKTLGSSVKGAQILVQFDWYPGKLNDKGGNPNENGGEFRILDSSGNIVYTLNDTKGSPLQYFAGKQPAAATGFTDPEKWYAVAINLDVQNDSVKLKLTDKATSVSEEYTSSLHGVAFDGSVSAFNLVGVRTSGNNITWTTYLDNIGVYNAPIPDNRISKVDKLPYLRVYVGQASQDVRTIGLPSSVKVTLANNTSASVPVREWTAVGKPWNSQTAGVYTFQGQLDVPSTLENGFNRYATAYVYNRLTAPNKARQTEWLNRGIISLNAGNGIFTSWRLLADEYSQDVKFNIYRNGVKLNAAPLTVTNFTDPAGAPGDTYKVETLIGGASAGSEETKAAANDYLSIPMQKPAGGTNATGNYTYSANDAGVGDLDGDGQYEVIVKWYPSDAIDSSQTGMTGPTIFDAYKMDGTLLWRMNMGLNLTSGAHYNQFIIADMDGDGKSEFLIKTADATTVYGTTNGVFDPNKVISVIGKTEDNGKWVGSDGHIHGGPEYFSAFKGATGEVIDTVNYAFPLGDVASWGDTWYNRSDRFLSGLAYLDGVTPSVVYGRGYYERTTYVAYNLVQGKLHQEWTFDSAQAGRGGGLGYHNLATGDVDNDGFDEIIAGSLTLDQDGTILYTMDGEMQREQGSHGDALHVGAFDPAREGLQVVGVHEIPAVASVELHDAATGETLMSYNGYVDTGRGMAANISSSPGFEFWGAAGTTEATGGGIYNVQGKSEASSFRTAGVPVNFELHWDGDLLNELLDNTSISKYKESSKTTSVIKSFPGVMSSNGTKATPSLQADILGDWREEVLLPTTDSSEMRIFSTTIPTDYRIFTLMHDPLYRNGVAWQNSAYNQPPHLGFYLGEDVKDKVLAGGLSAPNVAYPVITKSVVSSTYSPKSGETFEVNYGLAQVNQNRAANVRSAVYAQDVTITFDPNALEYAGVVSLKEGATATAAVIAPGNVKISLTSNRDLGAVTDDGDVMKLKLLVKSLAVPASTTVAVDKTVLTNGFGEKRTASVSSLEVLLSPADPATDPGTGGGTTNPDPGTGGGTTNPDPGTGSNDNGKDKDKDKDKDKKNSSSGSGSTAPASSVPPAPTGSSTTVEVKKEDLAKAAESLKNGSLKIQVSAPSGAKDITATLPLQDMQKLAAGSSVKRFDIDTGLAQLSLNSAFVKTKLGGEHTNLQIQVSKVDTSSLPANVQQTVGSNTVYDFNLSVDGEKVSDLGGGVTVSIPYTLKPGENPNKLVIYLISDNGSLETVKNGKYNPATGQIEFKPKHFSKYAAGYADISFGDLTNVDWAKESIDSLAARAVLSGESSGVFNPQRAVTRAEFLKMLMQALELDDSTAKSTLTDVKDGSWYYSSVAAAQQLGIVQGKADGSFGVNDQITREDMAVMAYRAAQAVKASLGSTSAVAPFADQADISGYASQAVDAMRGAGIIDGVGQGSFAPKGQANRAQAAVIIYRLFNTIQ